MTTPDTAAIRARLQAATISAEHIADLVLRDALELPDRTSPDDWPEALLITGDELHGLVKRHLNPPDEAAFVAVLQADLAALLEAYDARGEEIKRLRAEKIDALAGKQAELIADQDIEIARLRAQIAALIAAAEGARAGAWRSIDDEARSGDLVLLRRHNGCADYEYALVWWRPDRDPEYPWHGEYNSYPDLRFDEYQPLPAPPRAGGEP